MSHELTHLRGLIWWVPWSRSTDLTVAGSQSTDKLTFPAYLGYQYDWDWSGPFWDFLGKTVDQALFDSKANLREFNYVPVGRREFIAYTTTTWRVAAEAAKVEDEPGDVELPPLSVLEVSFKKPQPGQPLEISWVPARAMITNYIKRCKS